MPDVRRDGGASADSVSRIPVATQQSGAGAGSTICGVTVGRPDTGPGSPHPVASTAGRL